MPQSVAVMLANSGLADIPGSEEAVGALSSISRVATSGQGALSPDDLLAIAAGCTLMLVTSCVAYSRRCRSTSRTKDGRP